MSDNRVDVIRAAVAALNAGEVDGYLRCFDLSCGRWVTGLQQPLTVVEMGDNLRLLREGFEDLCLEEELLFGDQRFVCARWRLRGIHVGEYMGVAPTSRTIDVSNCEVYEFGEELVVAVWTYGDPAELFRQIGASEQGEVQ